jgi:hypothetical protein
MYLGVCVLRYFDSQEEKDKWLKKEKKKTRFWMTEEKVKERKLENLLLLECMPEHGGLSGYPTNPSTTEQSHIIDDDEDEYVSTGEGGRKRKKATIISSGSLTNLDNSSELLKLPNKQPEVTSDRFRMLSTQIVWNVPHAITTKALPTVLVLTPQILQSRNRES